MDLKNVSSFISKTGGASIRHVFYNRHGLRRFPPGLDAHEPVIDFISKEDVFAYFGTNSEHPHAVWVESVSSLGDTMVLRGPMTEIGFMVLELLPPTEEQRSFLQRWIEERDPGAVNAELSLLHSDLQERGPAKFKLGAQKKYRAVLAHALDYAHGELLTMAAIAEGHGEIRAVGYPGDESVARGWNTRFGLALENAGKPKAILDHWLERVNGINEELSPPYVVEGIDASDAALRLLAETNSRKDMVVKI